MKRYIKSSIVDESRITKGRASAANDMTWNISDEDAYEIIHESFFNMGHKYSECHYDDTGYAESKGYEKGIVFTTPGFRDVLYGLTHKPESKAATVQLDYLKSYQGRS